MNADLRRVHSREGEAAGPLDPPPLVYQYVVAVAQHCGSAASCRLRPTPVGFGVLAFPRLPGRLGSGPAVALRFAAAESRLSAGARLRRVSSRAAAGPPLRGWRRLLSLARDAEPGGKVCSTRSQAARSLRVDVETKGHGKWDGRLESAGSQRTPRCLNIAKAQVPSSRGSILDQSSPRIMPTPFFVEYGFKRLLTAAPGCARGSRSESPRPQWERTGASSWSASGVRCQAAARPASQRTTIRRFRSRGGSHTRVVGGRATGPLLSCPELVASPARRSRASATRPSRVARSRQIRHQLGRGNSSATRSLCSGSSASSRARAKTCRRSARRPRRSAPDDGRRRLRAGTDPSGRIPGRAHASPFSCSPSVVDLALVAVSGVVPAGREQYRADDARGRALRRLSSHCAVGCAGRGVDPAAPPTEGPGMKGRDAILDGSGFAHSYFHGAAVLYHR